MKLNKIMISIIISIIFLTAIPSISISVDFHSKEVEKTLHEIRENNNKLRNLSKKLLTTLGMSGVKSLIVTKIKKA